MTGIDPSYAGQRAVAGLMGVGALIGLFLGGFPLWMPVGAVTGLLVGLVVLYLKRR